VTSLYICFGVDIMALNRLVFVETRHLFIEEGASPNMFQYIFPAVFRDGISSLLSVRPQISPMLNRATLHKCDSTVPTALDRRPAAYSTSVERGLDTYNGESSGADHTKATGSRHEHSERPGHQNAQFPSSHAVEKCQSVDWRMANQGMITSIPLHPVLTFAKESPS
jgi:hypothetical protein